jgi:hypothetical protein
MNRPNFSGKWRFNPQKSNLQIQPPDSSTFVVEHNEPTFILTRTHVIGGKSDTFSITLNTNGNEVNYKHRGMEIKSRLYWVDDTLVFDSILSRDKDTATNIVKYRLENKERTFIAEEKIKSSEINYENIWIFEKDDSVD